MDTLRKQTTILNDNYGYCILIDPCYLNAPHNVVLGVVKKKEKGKKKALPPITNTPTKNLTKTNKQTILKSTDGHYT